MKPVMLDNVSHRDLRIVTTRGAAWGDDQMSTPVFLSELRDVQAHYPIVFQPLAGSTELHPVALLGLRPGENLFLESHGWDAHYVPLTMERGPFMIGRAGPELMVHLDMDSPRVSQVEGEPVFLPHGGATEFLEHVNSVLLAIHEGAQAVPAFIAALQRHRLIESFVMDIEAVDGSVNRLSGFHTIDEERLATLDREALGELHAAGYLPAIYGMLASVAQVRDLIDRCNRRILRTR